MSKRSIQQWGNSELQSANYKESGLRGVRELSKLALHN